MNVTLYNVSWLRVCNIRKPLPICSLGKRSFSCSLIKGKRSSRDIFTFFRFSVSIIAVSCLKTSSAGLISKLFCSSVVKGTKTVIF